jgi:hypothetical protein
MSRLNSNPVNAVSSLPHLFAGPLKTKEFQRQYEAFLIRLGTARQSDRMVTACRSMRRMARQAGRPRAAGFTYFWEMEAHGHTYDFEAMWRTLRAWEEAITGQRLNIRTHQWTEKDHQQLIFRYAPLLYLRGRYRLGCRLMEAALEMDSHRKRWSFDSLWFVYKPLGKPSTTYDVTLTHFYAALGRDLSEWKLWGKFLDGFDSSLFRSSGVTKEALYQNPRLMKRFFGWITAKRLKRLFTGTSDGERDLVDSPGEVERRQTARGQQMARFAERPEVEIFEHRLFELFPELAELPKQPSLGQYLRVRSKKP